MKSVRTEEATRREEIKRYMGREPDVNPQLQKAGKPVIASALARRQPRTPNDKFPGPGSTRLEDEAQREKST